MRRIRLIHAAAIGHGGSKRHPLAAHGRVLLRWGSLNLPPGVRVRIVRHSHPHQVGVGVSVAGNLGANGAYAVPVSGLAAGANYFTLEATLHGVAFQDISFEGMPGVPRLLTGSPVAANGSELASTPEGARSGALRDAPSGASGRPERRL